MNYKINFSTWVKVALFFLGFSICPNLTEAQNMDFKWVDVKTLEVLGRGWENEADFFGRLPSRAEETVPPSVWGLSKHTSGIYVRFKTNAGSMKVKWNLTGKNLSMPHFAATGVSG